MKIFIVMGLILLVALGGVDIITASNTRFNCKQIEVVKENLIIEIKAKDSLLDHKVYYKDHPKELADAHQINRQSIHSFRPRSCRGFFG